MKLEYPATVKSVHLTFPAADDLFSTATVIALKHDFNGYLVTETVRRVGLKPAVRVVVDQAGLSQAESVFAKRVLDVAGKGYALL